MARDVREVRECCDEWPQATLSGTPRTVHEPAKALMAASAPSLVVYDTNAHLD